MGKNSHMRWTDPLSGLRLLAGTIPADAPDWAKEKVFNEVKNGIRLQHGDEAADTVEWDK